MNRNNIIRSICTICPKGCGIIIHMEKGVPKQIEGDPENFLNRGKLCIKGLSILEYVFHPERLQHPLMRVGERGEGNWKQISWDQALDHAADAFKRIKKDLGPESVAFIRGASKSYIDVFFARLANVFGSPNIATMGQCCHIPRSMASNLTFGFYAFPDIDYPPSCMMIWGYCSEETSFYEHEKIQKAIGQGSKLIVIDPRRTNLARKADFWIPLRPGTDLALALGMINIMINEDLYDKEFVDKWTVGFEELKMHIEDYPPERVEEITWVPQKMLQEMTRAYAGSKPACIMLGNAVEHNHNSFQTARAAMILKAISGNVGVPGGEIQWTQPSLMGREGPAVLAGKIPKEIMEKRVTANCKILPSFKPVTPDTIVKAVIEGSPYPIRGAFVQGGNPLLSYPNAQNVYEALKKLDFLMVVDMFMTPTAAMADLVLPAASFLESDAVVVPPQSIPIALAQQKVFERGECRSDFEIIIELAGRLGLEEDFVWKNEEQAWDDIVRPSGLTFKEFKQIGKISGTKLFRQFESKGFNTPSGMIEIYSDQLKKWGYDPLPIYHEPPETPYSEPEASKKYPFILTSWKPTPFRHSWGHQINTLRKANADPVVLIHPKTAEKLDIQEGDWVYIETRRGQIKQKAELEEGIDRRVIMAEYGWWYPERALSDPNYWKDANVNVLTDDRTPYNRAAGAANEMGTPTLRGMMCNIHKQE